MGNACIREAWQCKYLLDTFASQKSIFMHDLGDPMGGLGYAFTF